MKTAFVRFLFVLVGILASLGTAVGAGVVVSQDQFLGADDRSLEGQDVTVEGAVLTVAGEHGFASLRLVNGARLRHPPAPAGEATNAVRLTLSGDLIVDAASRIDASGLGYGGAGMPGAATRGDYAGAGGGHGGRGSGSAGGSPGIGGAAFDSIIAPALWGGPGAVGSEGGFAPGGGVVQVEAGGVIEVSGVIQADGAGAWINNQGGGAGGTVFLRAKSFRGDGRITANGGGGEWVDGGGGAGGRIALLTAGETFAGTVLAQGAGGAGVGGAGTVFLQRAGSAGELRIANGARGEWTPIESPVAFDLMIGANAVVYPVAPLQVGNVTIAGGGFLTHATGSTGAVVRASGDVTIATDGAFNVDGRGYPIGEESGPGVGGRGDWTGSGAGHGGIGGTSATGFPGGRHYDSLLQPTGLGSQGGSGNSGPGSAGGGAIRLEVAGKLTVDGRLSADGYGAPINNSGGGSGGSLWVTAGALAGSGVISVNGGAGEWVDGGGGAGGRIALYYGTSTFSGVLSAVGGGGSQKGGAGTIYRKSAAEADGLLWVNNGGVGGNLTPLTSPEPFRLVLEGRSVSYPEAPLELARLEVLADTVLTHLTGQTGLVVRVRGDALVAAAGQITADGRGYPVLEDRGPGVGARGDWTGSGGGHGGWGGVSATGAAGGVAYGSLLEPTALGSQGGEGNSGPGAAGGGFLRLIIGGRLTVDGRVTAEGSAATINNSGGGAGGSLWITAGTLAGGGVLSVNGGAGEWVDGGGGSGGRMAVYCGAWDFTGAATAYGGGGSQKGGAGTIYQRASGTASGLLLVNNGGAWGNDTPLSTPEPFRLVLAQRAVGHPESALTIQELEVGSETVLTHLTGQSNLTIHALGNVTVAAGGVVHADGRGYPVDGQGGPGAGRPGGCCGGGAGHGGVGGRSAEGQDGGASYDSYVEPRLWGSQGGTGNSGPGGAGGGALRLVVDRELTVAGRISANGAAGTINNSGGGAGGSLWITAQSLAGDGVLSVDGGPGEWVDGGGGAGGRIALHLGQNTFTGAIRAVGGGGSSRGGSGSVYTRLGGEAGGTLVLDNGGSGGALSPLDVPPSTRLVLSGGTAVYPVAALDVVSLRLKTGATLTHARGLTGLVVRVAEDLALEAGAAITANALGHPVDNLVDPGAGATGGLCGGGGGHGGDGGVAWPGDVAGGRGYDSIVEPVAFGGSGGAGGGAVNPRAPGGGAIRVIVGGVLTVDGSVSADGASAWYNNQGAGAGGSVWLTAGRLLGGGSISAHGGNGEWVDGGGGAGGRVSLHVGTNDFAGTLAARGGGGHQRGGAGTLHTRTGSEAVGSVLIENGGNWGALTPVEATEPFRLELAANAQVYPVDTLLVGSLLTGPNTVLTQAPEGEDFVAVVTGDAVIGGRIDVSGRGYPFGGDRGPGAGGQLSWAGSGAGHGGLGGRSATGHPGGLDYGSATEPMQPGSQGGSGDGGPGGAGGGVVRLTVGGALTVDGVIAADGRNGTANNSGGGAGGSLLLAARTFAGAGTLTANGGAGEWVDGGGGAGGRIAIYRTHESFTGTVVASGAGGSARGEDGTIYRGPVAGVVWVSPPADWLAGSVRLEVAFFAGGSGAGAVTFNVWRDGVASLLGRVEGNLTAGMPWDTAAVPDGSYELEAIVTDARGAFVGSARRAVGVLNSALWHGGVLAGSETWEAGRVHLVRRDLTVLAGQSLAISPGAIVKFLPGTRLVLAAGATLTGPGSGAAGAVMTSFLDDTAGGDSNLDGETTRPRPGTWRLVVQPGATNAPGDGTRLRYFSRSYGGALPAGETWSGDSVREITETLTVPAGVTLRIEPGAILKFAPSQGLTVDAGGGLVVEGSVAEPIVFTSLRDDAFGGDSNGDGSRTAPAAGDWRSLRFAEGASVVFQHALVRFGGNSVGNPWGAGGAIEALGSALTVRNCLISDALKDGAFCYGTTRFENCVILRCDRGLTAVGPMEVTHCTIDACRIGLLEHVGQLNVRNSIVSRSLDAGIEHDLGGGVAAVKYCNVWNPEARRGSYSGVADATGRDGNIAREPRYKDPDHDNFRLNFASAGIDAADGSLGVTGDFAGTPRYDDPRTGNTGIPAPNGAVPDMGAYEFAETAPSNLDLAVVAVNGPGSLLAGETVQLEWTILNRGSEAFSGPWHDAIYLRHAVTGERLFVAEPLVGRSVTLGPGQSLTATADVRIPGGVTGDYRWVIAANSRSDVFEGANADNNEGSSEAGASLAVPLLSLDGGAVEGTFATAEEAQWFRVEAPDGRDFRLGLELLGGMGVAEVYAGRGFVPSPENFTARQREFGSSVVTAIAAANGGPATTWYVLVVGRVLEQVPAGYRLTANTAGFRVESATPGRIGNGGLVTLEVRGSGFATNTILALRSAGVTRTELRRGTSVGGRVFVTFDLAGFPAGPAEVIADTGGLTAVGATPVQVVEGGAGDFHAELKGPGTTRAGRTTTWFVTYGNRGLVDVPLPLVRFSAPGATELSVYESTLNWAPEFTFWALNPEALLPTLGPGQEVTFEVRLKTFSATRVELGVVPGEEFLAEPTSFGWSTLPAPAGADPAAWSAMVSGLDARLGATVGAYASLLVGDLADLASGPLRFQYLANLNGRWVRGDELGGVPKPMPPIVIPDDYREPGAEPALQGAPGKKQGDGIRKTWWLVVTLEDYENRYGNRDNNLPGCARDARDLWEYARQDLRTPKEQYLWAHDEPGDGKQVTRSTLLDGLRSLKGKIDADDNLVVVYSGHGGRTANGTPYLVFDGDNASPVAFTQAIDEVGAGTTYFVNNSCYSGGFNEGVRPANTTFVGLAATAPDKIAWSDDDAGGVMISKFKGQLRRCNGLGRSFELTTDYITWKYASNSVVKYRQTPTLANPSGASLEGKPWNDPSGHDQILARKLLGLAFQKVQSAWLAIVGSVDPNDKYALAGTGTERWVTPGQLLPFEIVFENKTNAAAPAQEVVVTDDLDPRLDWSTFELKAIAFNDATVAIPAGQQRYAGSATVGTDAYPVLFEAALNPATGRITWRMWSRDPATGELPEDPFAGFLPPNDATHRGEGALRYTVRSRADLPDRTMITNRATILFDPTYGANPPILTPWVTNTIDAVAPASAVAALPAQAVGAVPVRWSGADAAGGSGLASYSVFVARDDGPYEAWLIATSATEATFTGEPGSTYRFYSVAHDAAGNAESTPDHPDAVVALGGAVGPVAIAFDGIQITVTYTGTLQWAPSVTGPWTDIAGATSPYTSQAAGFGRYFRARQ